MSLVEFLARRISQWNDDCDANVAFFESTIKPRIQMVKLSILTVIRIAPTYTNRVLVRESILS